MILSDPVRSSHRVSITFIETTYGRGNDVPQLVYVPVDLNIDSPASAPDAYVTVATPTNAAGPQDNLLQIYDRTYFGEAISVSPTGRFAAVGATHEIIGGKVNVYEVVLPSVTTRNSSNNTVNGTNSSAPIVTSTPPHTGVWRHAMGMNASAETTAFEGAARISVNQLGHRFGGALSLSDEFAVVGAASCQPC